MNGELWAPGKPSFTKPYCGKWGSAAMDPIIPSYSWDSDEETEHSTKPTKEQQLFLKTRNYRSNEKQITPRAEEGYCKETTQSRPLTQSKPPSPECSGTYRGKTKKGLDKRGNRSDMVLYVLQITFYRKLQENI